MYIEQIKKAQREFLTAVSKGDLSLIVKPEGGMCINLHLYLEKHVKGFNQLRTGASVTFIAEMSEGWKYHSGQYGYPIGGFHNFYQAKKQGTLWSGTSLSRRKKLAAYILRKMDVQK